MRNVYLVVALKWGALPKELWLTNKNRLLAATA